MAILKVANVHHDASGFTRTQISTANTISWYTSNQERVSLDSSGELRVNGAVNASSILINGIAATNISNSYADIARTQANAAFTQANTALSTGQGAFTQASTARNHANAAFAQANTRLANSTTTLAGTLTITNDAIITGSIGIGTTSPTQKLHVIGNILSSGSIDCGTQFLGLAADASASPSFSFTDDTDTGMFRAGLDVLGFSAGGNEGMRLNSLGRLGIGIASPTFLLHVGGTANIASTLRSSSLGVGTAASSTTGEIRATNNIIAYFSDGRLKTVVSTIPNAIEKVQNLSGVLFVNNETAEKYGYGSKKEQVGVIAQEVEKVLPQIVVPAPFDIGQDDDGKEYSISGENYKTVQYEKLVPLLIEAIKELKAEIDELRKLK